MDSANPATRPLLVKRFGIGRRVLAFQQNHATR
jgi:hypothetical protein